MGFTVGMVDIYPAFYDTEPHMTVEIKLSGSPASMTCLHHVGTNAPFAQLNPRPGFSSAVALIQTTLAASKLCGKISIFDSLKFLHEVFVLHSIITASLCVRLGKPTLYQHG